MAALEIENTSSQRQPTVDTVPSFVFNQVALGNQRPAWYTRSGSGEWQTIDWATYGRHICSVASRLAQLGVRSGDRLGIMAPSSYRWEVLDKAALALGAIVVGVDAHAPIDQQAHILRDAAVSVLATHNSAALAAFEEDVRRQIKLGIEIDSEASTPSRSALVAWDDLLLGDPSALPPQPSPEDPATLIYTSGTTGVPKGILFTHRQLTLACHGILGSFDDLAPESRLVCWLPLANLFQRVMNLCAIGAGARTYFVADPRRLMEELPEIGPSVLIGVPRLFEKVMDGMLARIGALPSWQKRLVERGLAIAAEVVRCRRDRVAPSAVLALQQRIADAIVLKRLRRVFGGRIRYMIVGSAPTPRRVLEFYDCLGLPLLEAYGISENVVPIAANLPHARRLGSVGRIFPANEVSLADDGEIFVRGPGLFKGYYGSEPAPGTWQQQGFHATGDFGDFDVDGYLYLRGRKGDLIKTSSGRRLSPIPIEESLRQVPAIDQAVAIGNGRKDIIAIISPRQVPIEERASGKNALIREDLESLALEAAKACEKLASWEQVRGCLVVRSGFSVQAGHLTPNLKIRRGWIEQHYAGPINELYGAIENNRRDPTSVVPNRVIISAVD